MIALGLATALPLAVVLTFASVLVGLAAALALAVVLAFAAVFVAAHTGHRAHVGSGCG